MIISTRLNLGQRGGKLHHPQGGAFAEGARADGGHTLGQDDLIERHHTVKLLIGNLRQAGGPPDLFQGIPQRVIYLVGVDGRALHPGHAVGNTELPQGGIGKGVGLDGLQALAEDDIVQCRTAGEGGYADLLDAGGHRHALQPVAVHEGAVADFPHAVGDIDRRQGVAVGKRKFTEFPQLAGERDVPKAFAVTEGLVADGKKTLRQRERAKRFTALKCAALDLGHALGQNDGLQSPEAVELADGHRRNGSGPVQLFQGGSQNVGGVVGIDGADIHFPDAVRNIQLDDGAVGEGVGTDLLQAVVERNVRQADAAGEGAVSELPHAAAKRHLAEPAAGGEGRLVDGMDAVGDHEFGQGAAVRESTLADRAQRARKGDLVQRVVVVEGLIADLGQRLGQIHPAQTGAAVEGLGVNLCDAVRNRHRGNALLSGEDTRTDHPDVIRNDDVPVGPLEARQDPCTVNRKLAVGKGVCPQQGKNKNKQKEAKTLPPDKANRFSVFHDNLSFPQASCKPIFPILIRYHNFSASATVSLKKYPVPFWRHGVCSFQ